mmetsp:Transcript_6765/g.28425  ORF Transcript_6765/g.28425 Transcript_6765/m.28425 type:complete len:234 (-) Transcript_6765:3365-4066(-)
MAGHQGHGLVDAAVDDGDAGRLRVDQAAQHAGTGAARADQQQLQPGQAAAGVALDVVDEAGAVGVVTGPAGGVEAQRIDRTRPLCARCALGRQREGLELERHGDIAAPRTGRRKAAQRGLEAVERRQQAFVAQRLAGLRGEHRVDGGRAAVRHRVADDGIAVAHGSCPCSVVSRPSSRVNLKRDVMTSTSAPRSISGLKLPKGAAACTMASARRSRIGLPLEDTTSVSMTRPR